MKAGLAQWPSHLLTVVVVAGCTAAVARLVCSRVREQARTFRGWGERNEAALRAFVNARPEPAFLVDRRHAVLTLNQALADRLGRSIDEVLGRDAFSFLPDRDLARARAIEVDQVFRTGVATVFTDENRGRQYANHLSPVCGSNGEVWAVGVIAIDVTDLRRAQAEARRKEELLRFGLEASRLGVWEWDVRANVVNVSPEATRLLGAGSHARRGALSAILEYVEPEDRFRLEASLGRCVQGQVETTRVTFRARPVKTKPIRWLELQGRMFDSPDGGRRMVGTVADVTLQVEEEERRQRSEQELEWRVADRTRELTLANRELEAFSYSVSHDLRAPLRSIDGFALALAEDYGATLEPEARRYLDIVRSESQRMGQLIDDLLGLARLTRSSFSPVAVDLTALAQDIVGGLQRRDPERRVDVSIAGGLSVVGDVNLLRIALENLLGNAWKFTAGCPEARIEVATVEDGAGRSFCVRDNGVGFDSGGSPTLFQPFQRFHLASEYEGTGIGLATVARIVKRHGGVIWAESHPGKGASFRWTLPPPGP
jgi:PAS domain S-box-containing protein